MNSESVEAVSSSTRGRKGLASNRTVRPVAALVFLASAGVLGVATFLQPDPSGVGTHRQIFRGLPPCTAIALLGYPCPTCGMTTAFSHAVRGQFVSALRVQPAGFALAASCALAAVMSFASVLTGRGFRFPWAAQHPWRVLIVILLVLLGGWGYKLAVGLWTGLVPYR